MKMKNQKIDVIATTISGSISDWGKVKHIVPLFNKYGFNNVELFAVDSHKEARAKTTECISSGTRTIISAGGSGTFNAVLEGCCDSGVSLSDVSLGFLRKGSADLIGKVLKMPDNIDEAIKVFAESINSGITIKCDVIYAETEKHDTPSKHFVGYGGAEIFGEIPTYTENRFIKYYKGVLSQMFGDMGPFFVGACLASTSKTFRSITSGKSKWKIYEGEKLLAENKYQALIIVNGDLGKNLPLAKGVPLWSGNFYLFGLKNMGLLKLPGQFKHAWKATIQSNPERWGFETFRITKTMKLVPERAGNFKVNIDGSTMLCENSVSFKITDQINLISRE